MQIGVKTLTGKIINLEIEEEDTVMSMKERIQDVEGIPPEEQLLLPHNKPLEDHKTAADYEIHKDRGLTEGCSSIHLMLRRIA